MAYEKRICVLKQIKKGFTADGKTLSGAVHAERLGDTLTLHLKLLDFAPVKEGRYVLLVKVQNQIFAVDLEETSLQISNCPSIKEGLSALLCYVRGEAEPVAFGRCGGESEDYSLHLRAFSGEGKKKTAKAPLHDGVALDGGGGKYCDEAIAEDNYFERGKGRERTGYEDESFVTASGKKGAPPQDGNTVCQDDEDELVRPFLTGGGVTYYEELRERLQEAFARYPKDERLKGVFPQSQWVNADGGLLGIVYEGVTPKYICVASETPTEEMKKSACFVPYSPFTEEGIYVLFQSAETGEVVTVEDA